MTFFRLSLMVPIACGLALVPATAQLRLIPRAESPMPTSPVDYTDLAGLALKAPVVADVMVRSAERIRGEDATGLRSGMARFLVTGDVAALIRGPAGLPMRLSWLVDLPADAKGRAAAPKRKERVLLFARTLAGRDAQLQLIGLDAQRPWSTDADRITRAILGEALSADSPPAITGVTSAFFVPGALPGEGETQIFLQTADGRPVSLAVQHDATGRRTWSVALSEVTAAALPAPARNTLLWYRLACALPARLPSSAGTADVPANQEQARQDYAFIVQSLGRCAYPVRP